VCFAGRLVLRMCSARWDARGTAIQAGLVDGVAMHVACWQRYDVERDCLRVSDTCGAVSGLQHPR
jgi:hypothetical protein